MQVWCRKSPLRRALAALSSWIFAGLVVASAHPLQAEQNWVLWVASESNDEARQANAFLPNEIWVHEGDRIAFIFVPVNEIHTVSFLTSGQVRPSAFAGCPGTTPSDSSFDGSSCVNSGPMMNRAKYTVKFPAAGNFKLVCLVHPNMNGTVHVLPASAKLPYEQSFYTQEFMDQAKDLLHDADRPLEEQMDFPRKENAVIVYGEMVATAGGRQYLAIVRFLPWEIHVHVGETVEWMNTDPTEPHTVTFGTPPANIGAPENVTTAADAAFEATISSTTANVSSGILQAPLEDRTGLAQSPLGRTRIRITFTEPGTYKYICGLHSGLGMKGTVVVEP
ncbi:MAG: hypothetical protein JO356_06945 [Acidobacteria bacterium]|nr:hypothetical protein [Acidobacteriota bacterium]